jgi:Sigma-70 region 2
MSTYDDYSDGELVSLCLEDDRPASETLILRYRNLVYSIPMKHGFEPDDCGDVAHDVWVAFKANLHTLRDREKVYSWLMTTTTRKCVALASQKQKQQDSAQQTREEPFDPAGTWRSGTIAAVCCSRCFISRIGVMKRRRIVWRCPGRGSAPCGRGVSTDYGRCSPSAG